MKKNAQPKRPEAVTSAVIFNERQDKPAQSGKNNLDSVNQPITASVFVHDASALTFQTRFRNIIQFTFDSLSENKSGKLSLIDFLTRSISEMKSLCTEAQKRLHPDLLRRFNELIDEMGLYLEEEKKISAPASHAPDVQHYKHYVRLAWILHSILADLHDSSSPFQPGPM
jgi:hypothetical protein